MRSLILTCLLLTGTSQAGAFSDSDNYNYFCIGIDDLQEQVIDNIDISEDNYVLWVWTAPNSERRTLYSQGDDYFELPFLSQSETLNGNTYLYKRERDQVVLTEGVSKIGLNVIQGRAKYSTLHHSIEYGCFKKN